MADAVNSPYLENCKLLLNWTEGLIQGNMCSFVVFSMDISIKTVKLRIFPFLENIANLWPQNKMFLQTSFFFHEGGSKDLFAQK